MKMIRPLVLLLPLVLIFFTACEDEPDNTTFNTIGGFNITAPYYLVMVVDGDSVLIQEGMNGYTNGYGHGSGQADTLGNILERQKTAFDGPDYTVSIYFMETFPAQPTDTQIEDMFVLGNYSYGNSTTFPRTDGVEIDLLDSNNEEWSTKRDSSFSGNSFSVTAHETNTNDSFTPYATEGNFNAVLYNDSGDSMVVEGAYFRGRTVVYY